MFLVAPSGPYLMGDARLFSDLDQKGVLNFRKTLINGYCMAISLVPFYIVSYFLDIQYFIIFIPAFLTHFKSNELK